MEESTMLQILNRIKICIDRNSLDIARDLVNLEIENLNEALYYTQDGNEFRFIKSDNRLTVYYEINEKNTHYSRKLNS